MSQELTEVNPMPERIMKRASESFTTQVQVLTMSNLNGYSRLFGGQLMSWMDVVAAVTARRHSGMNVTTASVTDLSFHAPAHGNDTVVLTGEVIYVGRTSMEVKVYVYKEELGGKRILINEAVFTMVALDENEKPAEVPGLLIETGAQQKLWDEAEKRRKARSGR